MRTHVLLKDIVGGFSIKDMEIEIKGGIKRCEK